MPHTVHHLKKNNIAEYINLTNNGARKIKYSSLDDGEDGEHSGIDFVKISKIFAVNYTFFFEWCHLME